MKQTAVEFLQECLSIHLNHNQQMQFEGLFQQAKEMEKELMCEFAWEYERECRINLNRSIEDCWDKFNTKEK